MPKESKKIVVGLSGGIDSTVALLLLKEQGWDPIGISLKYAVWECDGQDVRENVCCSPESFLIARKTCMKLDVPYYTWDVSKDFQKEVITYFKDELKKGLTPNPCVVCNPNLKFKKLFEYADKLGIEHVATGHYARLVEDSSGKIEMHRGKDPLKDQTYSLSFLPEEMLNRMVLPLGKYLKSEIYEIAEKADFHEVVNRKQSQDFCFIANGAVEDFYKKELGVKPGPILDMDGKEIGQHKGIWFYTIGQRKGLELSNGPYYVTKIDVKKNAVIVSKDEADLKDTREILLNPVNLIGDYKIGDKITVEAKTRSHWPLSDAELEIIDDKQAKIIFKESPRAVTPGQYAVFYQGGRCLGGGRIGLTDWVNVG